MKLEMWLICNVLAFTAVFHITGYFGNEIGNVVDESVDRQQNVNIMAVFFDYKVETPFAGQHSNIQWHRKYPLLAVASFAPTFGSTISIYSEEGHSVDDFALKKAGSVTALDWHPLKKAVACGWESGDVAVYSLLLNNLSIVKPLHKHPVSVILWTSSGTRLVTGDKSGVLVIWAVDNGGHMCDAAICNHQLRQELTHAISSRALLCDYQTSNLNSDAAVPARDDESSAAVDQLMRNGRCFSMRGPVSPSPPSDNETLFIATKDSENGNVFSLPDAGNAIHQFATDGPVKKLLFCDERMCLITLTTKMVMTVHDTDWNGNLLETMKVKLSGRADDPDLILLGNGLLAYCTGESIIRVLDLHSHDNYFLSINSNSYLSHSETELVICLAYSAAKGVLCCGTASGLVCMWKYVPLLKDKAHEPEDCWKIQPSVSFCKPITSLMWGSSLELLAVKTTEHIYILCEQVMSAHCSNGTVVIQTAPMQLTVEVFSADFRLNFNSEILIKGICTTKENFAVWDHRRVLVYEIEIAAAEHGITKVGDFKSSTSTVCLYNQNAYTLENGKVIARNLQGVVKQILPVLEVEGDILVMDVCSQFLVSATTNNFIKVFHLCRSRDAKLVVPPKDLTDIIKGQGRRGVTAAKCNSNASKVSIIVAKSGVCNKFWDSRLYIWDTDLDSVQLFNFTAGLNQVEESLHINATLIGNSQVLADGRSYQTSMDVAGRHPSMHFWDWEDPRLLTVELSEKEEEEKSCPPTRNGCRTRTEEVMQDLIVSLFVTSDNAILIQDRFPKDLAYGRLLALEIPYFYFAKKTDGDARRRGLDSDKEDGRATGENRNENAAVDTLIHFGQGVFVVMAENEVHDKEQLSVNPSTHVTSEPLPSLPLHEQSLGILSDAPSLVNLGDPAPAEVPTIEAAAPAAYASSFVQSVVVRRTHRDLIGFESADKATKEALMNFSFCLCVGDMEEAFKAIKIIKSESIWETMAGMCIKSGRLDVARICLGNMSNPRVAMALREAMKEPELDARVAVLAIHLHHFEDAERLLLGCRRYDLLNQFYQAAGMWTQALNIAQAKDRIHLRATYYNYAKYSEDKGNLSEAICNYESSMTHRVEVPRMLLAQHGDLEDYISKVRDLELYKWWGHFMESVANTEAAARLYEQANDVFSLVKMCCSQNKLEKAKELCVATGNRGACYVLAQHLKKLNLVAEAMQFFRRAETYGPVIRICKEEGFEEQLINLALLGNVEDKIDVAEYYRKLHGHEDKAIMMYNKAGRISQAVQMAFQTKHFAALQAISESLTKLTEPVLLQRSADFFVENFQFDMAVELLALAKRYEDALRICTDQHVPMTEDLVEKLTPSKEIVESEEGERIKMLEAIAEVCFDQGQYHLATKKFIEAGNKVKAMKALLKSGDTGKIMYFAGVARQKEIYIMAANYLQSTTDWNKDLEIMSSIITFYKKGGAIDSLCNFYIACSQSEIDEFKNYEKALHALSEAYETLAKAGREVCRRDCVSKAKMNELKNRMAFVTQFLDAQSLYRENKTQDAIRVVLFLLKQPNIHHSVRVGDLLGFCISHYVTLSQWKPAYYYLRLLEKHTPKAQVTSYVDEGTIQNVLDALNVTAHEAQEPTAGDPGDTNGGVQLPI